MPTALLPLSQQYLQELTHSNICTSIYYLKTNRDLSRHSTHISKAWFFCCSLVVSCHTLVLAEPSRVVSSLGQGICHFTLHCTELSTLRHPKRRYFMASNEYRGYFRQPPPSPSALGLAVRPGLTAPRGDAGLQTAKPRGAQGRAGSPGWHHTSCWGSAAAWVGPDPSLPQRAAQPPSPASRESRPGTHRTAKWGRRRRAPPLICQRAGLGDGEGGGRRQGWSPRRRRGRGSAGGGHRTALALGRGARPGEAELGRSAESGVEAAAWREAAAPPLR